MVFSQCWVLSKSCMCIRENSTEEIRKFIRSGKGEGEGAEGLVCDLWVSDEFF